MSSQEQVCLFSLAAKLAKLKLSLKAPALVKDLQCEDPESSQEWFPVVKINNFTFYLKQCKSKLPTVDA